MAAARRGITHLAITDHDRIDGALRARDGAPDGLTVIVGEEVKTASGDLICLFLEAAVPPGLPPAETIALVREQGGLVGIPHPFDRHRSSMANVTEELDALAGLVDWVETYNARVVFREGNERAQAFALRTGLPGVAVSDAHSLLEVGVASTRVLGDPVHAVGAPRGPGHGRGAARACHVPRARPDAPREAGPAGPRQRPDPARRVRPAAMTTIRPPDPATPVDGAAARDPATRPTPRPTRRRDAGADQLSLGRRLRQPRTILSLVVPLVLLVLVFRVALNVDVDELVAAVRDANPVFLLAAFLVFYAGFPLRGFRWVLLLRGASFRVGTPDATRILFLSWLVNCLVPAKLGDVYRAYLLKINSTASLSRTFGTVFIERILDLFAIAVLGLAAGYWSFRNGLPPSIQVVFAIGVGVVVVLALMLLTLRNFGRQILVRLPIPRRERLVELYDRFEEGVFGAVGVRALPGLVIVTGLDLGDRGVPALLRRPGARLPGRRAGPVGGLLRRADRLASHGGPAQPGRPRDRGAGGRGRPDRRLRDPADAGHHDRARGPDDQRLLDHRLRRDLLRDLAAPQGRRSGRRGDARPRVDACRPAFAGSTNGSWFRDAPLPIVTSTRQPPRDQGALSPT